MNSEVVMIIIGPPWWLKGKESTYSAGYPEFEPWVGMIPWRRAWQPTPVFLPGESPWTEEPGPWGHKKSDTTERLSTAHAAQCNDSD